MDNAKLHQKENVFIVLTNIYTQQTFIHQAENIITDAGDVWYAQKGAGEATTNTFGIMELGTAGNTPAKSSNRSNVTSLVSGSQKAIDSGYPKTNDNDTDNPGTVSTDTVTRRVSYTTGEANATNIDRVIITNTSPGSSEPVLSYAVFGSAFTKTSSDTMKIFINHTFNGV